MWVDSLIGVFSPKTQYKRVRYRALVDVQREVAEIRRKYEGASKGRRTVGWKATSASANAEIEKDIVCLRNRARDLVRNNPYAKRAIKLISANIVGSGIRCSIRTSDNNEEKERELTKRWIDWGNNIADFNGMQSFWGLQGTAINSVIESGEVLARRVYEDGQLRLQLLESDYINHFLSIGRSKTQNKIVNGVEVDEMGRPLAYHLFKDHPGDSHGMSFSTRYDTYRVSFDELCHPFVIERPGQLRGVTWLTSVMMRMRDLDDYEDTQLVRQKIAACYAAFIKDSEILDEPSSGPDTAMIDKFEPGMIEELGPNKEIQLATPPTIENYGEYISVMLHSIATGVGCTYEGLSGDLSQVNFSSARMGRNEFFNFVDTWRDTMFNPMFNNRIFRWWLASQRLQGVNVDNVYPQWIAPKRELVDPAREVPAKLKAVRSGFESLEDVILERGKDPRTHLRQISGTNSLLDELGLILDSDPRYIDDDGKSQDALENQNDDEDNS